MTRLGMVVTGLICLTSLAFADETVYVQSVKAQVKREPKMSAPNVLEAKRGDALTVVKKDGAWIQVMAGGKPGWVSKLFVSSHAPVGEAEIAKKLEGDENLNKAARRRSSGFAVSATTRGLAAGNRVREGRETHPSDFEAVKKLDSIQVEGKQLQEFKESVKLGK